MRITNQVVASKLSAYLKFRLKLSQLVDWAENALMDGDFDGEDSHRLAEVVGRLGVADVREFGLSWEDCRAILQELGYGVQVNVVPQKHHSSSHWHEKLQRTLSEENVTTSKSAVSRAANDQYYVKRRADGFYVATRQGASRAGYTGPTQQSVIKQIKNSHPDAPIHVESGENVNRSVRDRWRKR